MIVLALPAMKLYYTPGYRLEIDTTLLYNTVRQSDKSLMYNRRYDQFAYVAVPILRGKNEFRPRDGSSYM